MTATLGSLTTPVRRHQPDPDGISVLRDTGSRYLDGGEERVLEVLRACRDVSSLSDEPLSHAQNWAERYHLSPARSNIVRPLDLPPQARVLEVGAGCGAVTRYLGERCAVVDALEPVAARARCIAERVRDLDSTRVFLGEVGDLPAAPTYDVVVVIGVLEYVGGGADDREPYRAFLTAIARRLAHGGTLVLAIENKLGVKYLAGAPEDHTDRVFDSVEGYPRPGPARTFDRRELTELLGSAGLIAETAVAFPDYKMTRAILRPDRLSGATASLLHRVPNFPSPDWVSQREPLADERLLWRSLVEAGLAADSGNSFLMLAGKSTPSGLWPDGIAGAFYSVGRRRRYATQSLIDVSDAPGGPAVIRRTRLARELSDTERSTGDGLVLRVGDAPFVPSRDLLSVLVDVDDPDTVRYLRHWRWMVDSAVAAAGPEGLPLDLVPHNLVIDQYDQVRSIDDEWWSVGTTGESILGRGALNLGIRLAHGARPIGSWTGCATIRDAVIAVGVVVGLDPGGDWVDAVIGREAHLQSAVLAPDRACAERDRPAAMAAHISRLLARELHTPVDLAARLAELRRTRDRAQEDLAGSRAQALALGAELAAGYERMAQSVLELERSRRAEQLLRQTVSWRVTTPLRWGRRVAGRARRLAGRTVGRIRTAGDLQPDLQADSRALPTAPAPQPAS